MAYAKNRKKALEKSTFPFILNQQPFVRVIVS